MVWIFGRVGDLIKDDFEGQEFLERIRLDIWMRFRNKDGEGVVRSVENCIVNVRICIQPAFFRFWLQEIGEKNVLMRLVVSDKAHVF